MVKSSDLRFVGKFLPESVKGKIFVHYLQKFIEKDSLVKEILDCYVSCGELLTELSSRGFYVNYVDFLDFRE